MPNDELIYGAAFTEQLRTAMELTGDPQDRIILEIGREIERMDELLDTTKAGNFLKQSQKAVVMRSRAEVLTRLYDLIQERRDRLEQEGGATLIAQMVIKLQEVLDDLKIAQELRTAVIQNLLVKIEEEDKRKKPASRR